MCRGDERCAGYYKSSTREPVLAMAGPGKCTLWWTKLPTADQPQEADVCRKFLGDKLWKTDGEGFCVHDCTGDRTKTVFCKTCSKGFARCGTCAETCAPITEDTCPTGWTLEGDGVCRPTCNDTLGREADGNCREHNGNCITGYSWGRYGQGPLNTWPWTYYCKPNAGLIKNAYYKTAT
jgi:hypothetical protein